MKFAIYKYELVKTNTKELFQENKSVYDNAQVYFGNLFNAISLIYIKSLIRMDCLNAFLIQFLRHVME